MVHRRAVELGDRVQKALGQNPEWALERVKNLKSGEPLPYDPRLGVSRAEWDEYLALGKKMFMRKKSEATLVIANKDSDDIYILDGGKSLPDFTGIEIDLKNDLVRTPLGVAKNRSEIHADEQSAIGAWNGAQWQSDDDIVTAFTKGSVKLAIGSLQASGRGVLYYDATKIGIGNISHVLIFNVPGQ
ncbi:MAG TPA: hypothetical protein VGY55_22745 [Pirellulales bacterium]|nr:hypothetical protein [Pirellulales bacterium]